MVRVVHVIGGGLAGSEAAWQFASAGVPVVLHEMRPVQRTEAHQLYEAYGFVHHGRAYALPLA